MARWLQLRKNLAHRSIMAYQVTVMPSGHKFEVATDETILGAALRHSIGLPYGCKNGACGSCKGRVLEGTIVQATTRRRR